MRVEVIVIMKIVVSPPVRVRVLLCRFLHVNPPTRFSKAAKRIPFWTNHRLPRNGNAGPLARPARELPMSFTATFALSRLSLISRLREC
jgi:hypothetical protein